jgi:hypothetical protein
VVIALGVFVLSQLAIIGIGLLPVRLWWSYNSAGPREMYS